MQAGSGSIEASAGGGKRDMKRGIWIAGGAVLILAAVGASVFLLGQKPAAFYEQALVATKDESQRKADSKRFVQSVMKVVDDAQRELRWTEELSIVEMNAWLADELPRKYSQWLPRQVREPRVAVDGDRLLIGAEIQRGGWNGVLSVRLRPWLSRPNELALEIESIAAGILPLPVDQLLEEVVRRAERDGWKIGWREVGGHDVLLINLDERLGKNMLVDEIGIADGRLVISGRRDQIATLEDLGARPR